jgi:hypothetical protein
VVTRARRRWFVLRSSVAQSVDAYISKGKEKEKREGGWRVRKRRGEVGEAGGMISRLGFYCSIASEFAFFLCDRSDRESQN